MVEAEDGSGQAPAERVRELEAELERITVMAKAAMADLEDVREQLKKPPEERSRPIRASLPDRIEAELFQCELHYRQTQAELRRLRGEG